MGFSAVRDTNYLNGRFSLYDPFSTNCHSAVRSRFYGLQVVVSAGRALASTCYFILVYFMSVFNSAASSLILTI